jgi:hypothetical protein
LGLLVGLEREWSNKDIGARTFAMTALLGLLGAMLGTPLLLLSGVTVLILIVFANLRGLQAARKLEATTSVALAIIFLLGVLVGQGHLFTPVACSILVAMLLSLKPQLRAFAGGLSQQEVRSALLLGLLGFVIWPLLPDRFVDPWQLIQPREEWITVVVIACLGFLNYVLLRIYGSKGIYLAAVFGGLVNSTATVAELVSTLSGSLVAHSHREHNAKLCIATHHAGICFGCLFQGIGFDHGAYATQLGKAKCVIRIGRRSRCPSLNSLAAHDELNRSHLDRIEGCTDHDKFSVRTQTANQFGHGLRVRRCRNNDSCTAQLL